MRRRVSSFNSLRPFATFFDDLKAARDAIVAETTQGRDVVVVVHSFGGIIGSSAIKGLTQPKKDASPTDPSCHVIGLALMATGFAMTGVSFLDGGGGKPPPSWKLDLEKCFAVLLADPRQLFYHDLPEEEGNYWVGKLGKQALKALTEGGEHVYAGWMEVPCWYLATTEEPSAASFCSENACADGRRMLGGMLPCEKLRAAIRRC